MGFRLKGEPLHLLHPKELVSAATTFGTIQLLPDGQMIVLMADHQTAGRLPESRKYHFGRPSCCRQLGSGDRISFKLVSTIEAETAQLALERDLRFFKVGCRLTVGC
jgi:antagonist of KipI